MSRLPRTCCSERSSNGTCRSAPRTSSVIYAVSNKRSRLASRRNQGPPAALAGQRIGGVVHCAAKTKVVESMEKEELYRDVIVRGTENVVGLARQTGASIFVNISTGGAIYGETPVCAEENTPVDPPSNYGRFKAQAEQIVAGSRMPAGAPRPADLYP